MAIQSVRGHDLKWNMINKQLSAVGYTVIWMHNTDSYHYRYLITRLRPYERLGVFDDEDTALGMAKLLVTEAGMDFPWNPN